jgi:hypothetical protein
MSQYILENSLLAVTFAFKDLWCREGAHLSYHRTNQTYGVAVQGWRSWHFSRRAVDTTFLPSTIGANTLRCCRILSFPRAFWIAQRESSLCLLTVPAVVRAVSRFRWYSSRITPSSLPTNTMYIDVQGSHLMAIRGQSGRQYRIERALQDKGSLLGRVSLVTHVLTRASTGF